MFQTNDQKDNTSDIKFPYPITYAVYLQYSLTLLHAPISTDSSSTSPKPENSVSSIWPLVKFYAGQKLKYASNITKSADDIIVKSIHQDTYVDTTCDLTKLFDKLM